MRPERRRFVVDLAVSSLIATGVVAVIVSASPNLDLHQMRPFSSVEEDSRLAAWPEDVELITARSWASPKTAPTTACTCNPPRRAYAGLIRKLNHWGARVIVLCDQFADPCPAEDGDLAEAMRSAGNVVLEAVAPGGVYGSGLRDPVEPFAGSAFGVGHPWTHPAMVNAWTTIPLVTTDAATGREYAALSLVGYECFAGNIRAPQGEGPYPWSLVGGRRRLRLKLTGQLPFYIGQTAEEAQEARHSWRPAEDLSAVLGLTDRAGRSRYEGKAVVVESNSLLGDAGVHVRWLGSFIEGTGDALVLSPWLFLAVMLGAAVATSLVTRRAVSRRPLVGMALFALAAPLLLMVAFAVTDKVLSLQFRDPWITFLTARWPEIHGDSPWPQERFVTAYGDSCYTLLVIAMGLAWAVTASLQSGRITRVLARFVPSFLQVREPGISPIEQVQTLTGSLLFADIRNYTTVSEKISPEDLLRLLGAYRRTMEAVVARHGGTIAVTPGDAVLSVFWRERHGANHATCAVRAGREMVAALPSIAPAWEARGVPLDIGVGINTGEVAAGFIGTQDVEAMVAGDAVNVAQRLEALTKEVGHRIVLSETTRDLLADEMPLTPLGEVALAGRTKRVTVYAAPEREAQPTANGRDGDVAAQGAPPTEGREQ